MKLRDRVKELRRVPAGELKSHPKNWRTHSRFQQEVLKGILKEVGFVGALVARELPDGTLQLLDGHLRADTRPADELPVLIVDLNEEEAEKVLLTHDPIASLAGIDEERLSDLLDRVDTDNQAVDEMLLKLESALSEEEQSERSEMVIHPSFQVVVEVEDEASQQKVYDLVTKQGFRCRVLTL